MNKCCSPGRIEQKELDTRDWAREIGGFIVNSCPTEPDLRSSSKRHLVIGLIARPLLRSILTKPSSSLDDLGKYLMIKMLFFHAFR